MLAGKDSNVNKRFFKKFRVAYKWRKDELEQKNRKASKFYGNHHNKINLS